MTDAWVWDMYRPRALRQERQGLTFKDVNVEELAKRPELEPPKDPRGFSTADRDSAESTSSTRPAHKRSSTGPRTAPVHGSAQLRAHSASPKRLAHSLRDPPTPPSCPQRHRKTVLPPAPGPAPTLDAEVVAGCGHRTGLGRYGKRRGPAPDRGRGWSSVGAQLAFASTADRHIVARDGDVLVCGRGARRPRSSTAYGPPAAAGHTGEGGAAAAPRRAWLEAHPVRPSGIRIDVRGRVCEPRAGRRRSSTCAAWPEMALGRDPHGRASSRGGAPRRGRGPPGVGVAGLRPGRACRTPRSPESRDRVRAAVLNSGQAGRPTG
jgi:hypothetical protein